MKPKNTGLWREESIRERRVYLHLLPCATPVSCSAQHRAIPLPSCRSDFDPKQVISFFSLQKRTDTLISDLPSIEGIFSTFLSVFCLGYSCKDFSISHVPFLNNYLLFSFSFFFTV